MMSQGDEISGRSRVRAAAAAAALLCLGAFLVSRDFPANDPSPLFKGAIQSLSAVASKSSPYRPGGNRYALMDDPTKRFSFVHISKCAGAAWIRTLKHIVPGEGRVVPEREDGYEFSVRYQTDERWPGPNYYRLISLKSPRHIVWSLFVQCKYGGWGVGVTEKWGKDFPRTGSNPADDMSDFRAWLDHFVPLGANGSDHYGCYHPANYQARALATTDISIPHNVLATKQGISAHDAVVAMGNTFNAVPRERFEPDLNAALDSYWEQDWVALTEFFHESQCLLFYRLGEGLEEARAFVENQCRCHEDDELEGNKGKGSDTVHSPRQEGVLYVSHHSGGKRSTMRDLPEEILEKISVLTKIDAEVYRKALLQFMEEVAWLESDKALGRRVLCEPTLKKVEPELKYLRVSVTELYRAASEHENNTLKGGSIIKDHVKMAA